METHKSEQDILVQDIQKAYTNYFGCKPRIKVEVSNIKVSGVDNHLSYADWFDIIYFWGCRYTRGKTEKDFFNDEDFIFLQDLREEEVYSTRVLAVILDIEYRILVSVLSDSMSIKEAFLLILYNNKHNKEFKHEDNSMYSHEWAVLLGISEEQFLYRILLHGKHPIAFSTPEEYFSVKYHKRKRMRKQRRFFKKVEPAPDPQIRCPVDYKDAKTLVVTLIVDAKNNVAINNKYAKDSYLWLHNEHNTLEQLIELIEEFSSDSLVYIIEECAKYANKYYKGIIDE